MGYLDNQGLARVWDNTKAYIADQGFLSSIPIASTSSLGGIKPDGNTITVDPLTGVASASGGGGGSTPVGSWQMTLADGSPFTVTLTDSGQQTLVQSYTQLEMNDMLSTLTSLDL